MGRERPHPTDNRIDPPPAGLPKPMKVTAQYAEQHFADLLTAADTGEEVEIAHPDHPTYRLELVKPEPPKPTAKRILGAGRRKMIVPTWEEWKALDKISLP
jgi:antitoxin (DNA-binding transcriptional repressor) of toxin-antitoxin stability system